MVDGWVCKTYDGSGEAAVEDVGEALTGLGVGDLLTGVFVGVREAVGDGEDLSTNQSSHRRIHIHSTGVQHNIHMQKNSGGRKAPLWPVREQRRTRS